MSDPLDEDPIRDSDPADDGGISDEADEGVGDAPMRASILSVFFTGMCFAVVGSALFGMRTGLGVLIGGLIATANLWVFARVGQAFIGRKGNSAPWGIIALLKMAVLFGGVWMILRTGVVSALSLISGYCALPIGITVGSLFGPPPGGGEQNHSARRGRNVIRGARAARKG